MSRPLPPADIDRRTPRLITVAPGALIHRFYPNGLDPIHHDRSLDGRLNASNGSFGVLYAAKARRGAFAETFLRTPGRRTLDPALQARKAYATLEVASALTLIELDGPGLAILGATAEVVHGSSPYDCPQAWSTALHAHPMQADGIAYTARHDPHELCYALFDRAAASIREKKRVTDLDVNWFWQLADVYQVGRAPGP